MEWLSETTRFLAQQLTADRLPHAILLTGRPGIGKRALACWLTARYLGLTTAELPRSDERPAIAPDLVIIEPLEDKTQLSVDQVRALIDELSLTSHAGAGKAAIVWPAQALTDAASNSLLKTLEAPPGDCLIVLVADEVWRLPATILSRCLVLRLTVPAAAEAEAWLRRGGVEEPDVPFALTLSDGAPLLAREMLASGRAADARQLASDLEDVIRGAASPLAIAQRWKGIGFGFALHWLEGVVVRRIRHNVTPSEELPGGLQDYVIDSRNLFSYLERLRQAARRRGGSFDETLALESLLMPWRNQLAGLWREQVTTRSPGAAA
jgi:DNA polymerase-3 subunit delta'